LHSHDEHNGAADRHGWLVLAAVLVPLAAATVAGLITLWPQHAVHSSYARQVHLATSVNATVTATAAASCGTGLGGRTCRDVSFRLPQGRQVSLNLNPGAGQPELKVGDRVVLARSVDAIGQENYSFDDFQRTGSLKWLILFAAAAVVLVARLRGLAALIGVALSALGIGKFLLPSLLTGHNPIAVAGVAASALLFVVLYLAHGFSARTSAALVGTLSGLGLCLVLSSVATNATRVTGLSSEDFLALEGFTVKLDLHQLLVCSFVIGALGVLNDVTITQASAVWELHASDPRAPTRTVYRRAMRIGRDHIASSVYTLLFAYAGAALPTLLVLALLGRPAGQIVNGDQAAVEIVRAAVGIVGLVAAVPITTAMAVLVVRDRKPAPFPRASAPNSGRESA
jgi:uncharacterized membrane protein